MLTTVPCASPFGRCRNRGSKTGAPGPPPEPCSPSHPDVAPCLTLPGRRWDRGRPRRRSLSGLFWEILGGAGRVEGGGPRTARSPPRAPSRRAALGPPSLATNFGQSGGGGGALRAGGESARRNAQDALFPARRPNVLGPGRGGV